MPSFLKKSLVEKDGIFSFPIDDDKTKKVVEFYKVSPFPNYKNNDDRESIIEKGDKNILAYQFKKFIGHNKKVLEVGCGTGQLSIYFAIGTNNEIGLTAIQLFILGSLKFNPLNVLSALNLMGKSYAFSCVSAQSRLAAFNTRTFSLIL